MSSSINFQTAKQLFDQGKYQQALEVYLALGERFGKSVVEYNVKMCREKQGLGDGENEVKNELERTEEDSVAFPLVSVVMPVFNVAPYLDASITAVLNQTYQNLELIIVNDASTDNSLHIINRYAQKDSRIKLINLEFNTLGGAGIPSNIGIDAAKGTYLAFVDSDDIMAHDAIEKMLNTAKKYHTDVVIADFVTFDNETKKVNLAYDKDRWSDLPKEKVFSAKENPHVLRLSSVPWRKLYKLDFLNKNNIRFPEGDYFYEDNPLHWFVLCQANRIVLLDHVVASHRMEREGQTMQSANYKLLTLFNHLNTIKVWLQKNSMTQKAYWQELLDFCYRTNWVVEKQDEPKIKLIAQKRYAQVASEIVKVASVPNAEIENMRPNFFTRCEQYSRQYEDKDLAIVIPVYNCVDLVESLVLKLLTIKLKTEIFLIDDGSTDGSAEVCSRLAQKYSEIVFVKQSNKGAGVARNTIIPFITAKYTYFVDADDDIEAESIQTAYQQAIRYQQDLVFGRYKIQFYDTKTEREMWKADEDIWKQMLSNLSKQDKLKALACQLTNYPWNRLIKTSLLLDENIFFGKTVVHNDVPFHWHSIISAQHIGVCDKVFCIHRKFEVRPQITNIADDRRLQVLEAYRYTHHLLKEYSCYNTIFPYWQKFIRDLLTWARDRVPAEKLEFYKKRHKQIVESLKNELEDRVDTHQSNNVFHVQQPTYEKLLQQQKMVPANKTPKVSIIVPIYNVGRHLRRCLESIIHQTLTDIEIICIDDCSTDGSNYILKEYEDKDERVKCIYHEPNLGTAQTRKHGVLASIGEYIMFVDGDDALELNAAEVAYNTCKQKNVDILHFGFSAIDDDKKEENVKFEQVFMPYIDENGLKGDLLKCFASKNIFKFRITDKMFKGDVCRTAFTRMPNKRIVITNDLFAFVIIASFCKSYYGIKDKLYIYTLGVGVTGNRKSMTIEDFSRLLKRKNSETAIREFLEEEKHCLEYGDLLQKVKEDGFNWYVNRWEKEVPIDLKSEALELLLQSNYDIIPLLATKFWQKPEIISDLLVNLPIMHHVPRLGNQKLTIAFYYFSIAGGGAQRITALLCNLLAKSTKYNVVLITDENQSELNEEFFIEKNIKRYFIPNRRIYTKKNYKARFEAWQRVLSDSMPDVVVHCIFEEPISFWDMLTIKTFKTKPAFITHSHNFCCKPFLFDDYAKISSILGLYKNVDGIVTISESDKRYAEAFNKNAIYIENPLTFNMSKNDSGQSAFSEKESNLIWCGRLQEVKRPLDAIETMSYIVKELPDIKLYMLGDGDKNLLSNMQKRIKELCLERNVVIVGYSLDVESYYKKSKVFIHTSKYEGYPTVFGEALAHGLPIVTYDMPWLSMVKETESIITVDQKRYDLMAKEVIKLLKNEGYYKDLSRTAVEYIKKLSQVNIFKKWERLFASLNTQVLGKRETLTDDQIIFKYSSEFHVELIQKLKDKNIDDIKNLMTLFRIDIKNFNDDFPQGIVDIDIMESDGKINRTNPEWFSKNNNGIGTVLNCFGSRMRFKVTTSNEGALNIILRAEKLRVRDQVRPLYMICEYLKINDIVLIDKEKIISHDTPYKYKTKVNSSDVTEVEVKWRACDVDLCKYLNEDYSKLT